MFSGSFSFPHPNTVVFVLLSLAPLTVSDYSRIYYECWIVLINYLGFPLTPNSVDFEQDIEDYQQ